jgi:putative ABC transport system substrate-binding protein
MGISRRQFVMGAGGLIAVGGRARGQEAKAPVVGFLHNADFETRRANVDEFLKGLADMGYRDGANVVIEYRWANNDNSKLPRATSIEYVLNLQAAKAGPRRASARDPHCG